MNAKGRSLPRRDLILILAILSVAGIWYCITRYQALKGPSEVDGKLVETLDLSVDATVTITGAGGGTNVLVVQDGEIWCSEASCPDKLCVKQGKKHLSTDTIVCLPNKMVVTVTGTD